MPKNIFNKYRARSQADRKWIEENKKIYMNSRKDESNGKMNVLKWIIENKNNIENFYKQQEEEKIEEDNKISKEEARRIYKRDWMRKKRKLQK